MSFTVPTGTHIFSAKTEATTKIKLQVEAEKQYYIRCSIGPGFFVGRIKFTLVDAQKTQQEMIGLQAEDSGKILQEMIAVQAERSGKIQYTAIFALLGGILGIPLSYYFQPQFVFMGRKMLVKPDGTLGYLEDFGHISEDSKLLTNVFLSVFIFAIVGGIIGYLIDKNES